MFSSVSTETTTVLSSVAGTSIWDGFILTDLNMSEKGAILSSSGDIIKVSSTGWLFLMDIVNVAVSPGSMLLVICCKLSSTGWATAAIEYKISNIISIFMLFINYTSIDAY